MTKRKKYNLTDDFLKALIDFSGGLFSANQFEDLVGIFEREICKYNHYHYIETNLRRIIASQFDRISFLKDALVYQSHIEIITAIAANSNYLSDILVRNPVYISQLFDNEYLQLELLARDLKNQIEEGIKKFRSFESQVKFLKNFKRRLTLKIGLCDILGIHDFILTTHYISLLARTLTAALFSICYKEILAKYKIASTKRKYALAALGKLGGNELNYSSDIDLILFYDENKMVGQDKQFEFHQIISETAQLFIQKSSEDIGDGHLYRIDFRLRPDGQYSPICRKMNDYLKYYEVRGENWERQMLIKLDFVTGNRALYDSFRNFLQPFIYPASFLSSPLEQIRNMKKEIEARTNNENNIKLFQGGIRDIEFSVQALQLLNGGKLLELQTGNTLQAIDILHHNNLLSNSETVTLKEAYLFYRKIEHYMQLMNNLQTHRLPEENHIADRLSRFMKKKSASELNRELNFYRQNVKKIYDSITSQKVPTAIPKSVSFENINFIDRERAIKNFRYLKSGLGIFAQKEFDKNTIQRFDNIEQQFLKYLQKSPCPDRIIDNFTKIIKNVKTPSIWYSEFGNNKFFMDCLTICEFSQYAVDQMTANQSNCELLLTRKVFTKVISQLYHELSLPQISFILSIQFALRLISKNKFSKILCEFVDHKIKTVANEFEFPYTFFIAALGSLGTGEMNFASDIDIIFVADNIPAQSNIQKDFQILFDKLREDLKPFKLDARLRPEGKSSPLVWDLKNYSDYLTNRAKVWEFQSLIKLRLVTGKSNTFNKFKKIVIDSISFLDSPLIESEIKKMYSMKLNQSFSQFTNSTDINNSKGGITQINFLLDEVILKNIKKAYPCIGKNAEWKINFLQKQYLLKEKGEILSANYANLKKVELASQNILHVNNSIIPKDGLAQSIILKFLKRPTAEQLTSEINKLLNDNSIICEQLQVM